jgi:hypothetical protein
VPLFELCVHCTHTRVQGPDSPNIVYAEAVLTTSVLAILVCGTLGTLALYFAAPRCLARGADPSPGTPEWRAWQAALVDAKRAEEGGGGGVGGLEGRDELGPGGRGGSSEDSGGLLCGGSAGANGAAAADGVVLVTAAAAWPATAGDTATAAVADRSSNGVGDVAGGRSGVAVTNGVHVPGVDGVVVGASGGRGGGLIRHKSLHEVGGLQPGAAGVSTNGGGVGVLAAAGGISPPSRRRATHRSSRSSRRARDTSHTAQRARLSFGTDEPYDMRCVVFVACVALLPAYTPPRLFTGPSDAVGYYCPHSL